MVRHGANARKFGQLRGPLRRSSDSAWQARLSEPSIHRRADPGAPASDHALQTYVESGRGGLARASYTRVVMRHAFSVLTALAVVSACSIDVTGTLGAGGEAPIPTGADGGASGGGGPGGADGGASGDGAIDPDTDGATGGVVPSHVGAALDPAAPDLSSVAEIDTSARSVTLADGTSPALRFEDVGGRAVLFVGAWTVDKDVVVKGSAPLVVLAAREVLVAARLDASANGAAPGPGGSAGNQGQGKGSAGSPAGSDDPGGGGGGFGTAGARGGNGNAVTGGAPGAAYGAAITDFFGGSGGGNGTPFNVAPCTNGEGAGGAGGGALQITSAVSVKVDVTGTIISAGGGGQGGCINGSNFTMSGGGGGSGGLIFLEAPGISIAGVLAANGGGGGGGAQVGTGVKGEAGEDGKPSLSAALGGPGSTARAGGNGATRALAPVQPAGNNNNAGGGGGGVGRIWLRTRSAPAVVTSSIVTPAAETDTSL
jgi:hypothetical protein